MVIGVLLVKLELLLLLGPVVGVRVVSGIVRVVGVVGLLGLVVGVRLLVFLIVVVA